MDNVKSKITMKQKIFFALALSLLMVSCHDDEYLSGYKSSDGAGSVLSVTSANKEWTEGDHIGLFSSTAASDASSRNRDFVVQADGRTLKSNTASEFYVKGNYSILAYYPFVGTDGAEPELLLSTLPGEVKDYWLAKTDNVSVSTAQDVQLNFYTCLSKMNVTLQMPAGETVSRYVLSGIPRRGRIDPYSFEINPEYRENYEEEGSNITSFSIDIIPQTLADGAAILTLKGQERTYPIVLPEVTIDPNSVCNVTVNAEDGQVNYEFIHNGSAWNDSGLGDDNATSTDREEGEARQVTKTYDFMAYDYDASAVIGGRYVLFNWGESIDSDVQAMTYGSETFDNRFAAGPETYNGTTGNGFKLRISDATWRGLYCQYADRYFAIRDLKVGDKVTITMKNDRAKLKFKSTNLEGTTNGSDVGNGTQYTVNADGMLKMQTTAETIIQKIEIISTEN